MSFWSSESKSVYEFAAEDLNGAPFPLKRLDGFVLLIVNTASKGLSKKYLKRLSWTQDIFGKRRFLVLAFPCNQFLSERPQKKIHDYYVKKKNYGFKVLSKVKVKGKNAHPLFKWLTKEAGAVIGGDFNKFLLSSDGSVVRKFGSSCSWMELLWNIDVELRKSEAKARLQKDGGNVK